MIEYIAENKIAIIVLHEIYGLNQFIQEECLRYHHEGYDVFCPNLLGERPPFTYTKKEEAYHHFINNIGFDVYYQIIPMINRLKEVYEKVILIGYSIGATIAWRCNEIGQCDGVVCLYGARIRDYLSIKAKCKTLLIFAEHDSFNAYDIKAQLTKNENIDMEIYNAKHGFCDSNIESFDNQAYEQSKEKIRGFLETYAI